MWHPDMPEEYKNQIVTGDALELIKDVPDESVHLVFVDPPYNIGKAKWDKIDNYLDWCWKWIKECCRVLKFNGAFWVSHNKPLVLARFSEMIASNGRGLINWITWDKYHVEKHSQVHALPDNPGLRSFAPLTEYLIYHADEGDWSSQCDKERGFIFEPLRAYLVDEIQRAGAHKEDINEWLGFRRQGGMASRHYFSRSQWCLPTEEHYTKMRECLNRNDGNYLRREYEDLRREYEDLRYTFNNPGKMSSVWQVSPAQRNFHITPKPPELMKRIIEATSNEGDIVLDPMCGSGTTALVAQALSRNHIAFERNPEYAELARERIRNTQPPLFVMEPEQLEIPEC